MDARYVDALSDVVRRTVNFMFPVEARLVDRRSEYNREAPYEVSGIIGFAGPARGTVVISFPIDVARQLTAWMLTEEDPSICTDQDISDCVGELANIIGGNLLPVLVENDDENGDEPGISLPSVVVGDHRVVWGSKDTPCELIQFETEVGVFAAEINLREALVES